jgi:hypothetical protein
VKREENVCDRKERMGEERGTHSEGHWTRLGSWSKETSAALNLNTLRQGRKPLVRVVDLPPRTRENQKPFLVFHYDK